MLLSKYNLLYIHPPKTAGNAIQSVLLPFSDDRKVVSGHRDGHDRYEVAGMITTNKHMTLEEYEGRLGARMSDYRVAISVRHPVERAISMYFSPHRWFRKAVSGGYDLAEPVWDRNAFDEMLSTMPSISDFVTVNGEFRKPDFAIRQNHLDADLSSMCKSVGLPEETWSNPVGYRNTSAGQAPLIQDLLRQRALKRDISDHFAADFENFDFK